MQDEKTSGNRTQWQEQRNLTRSVATRPMTKTEIEEFRKNLVASYGCNDDDIEWKFEKITNEFDEDRDTCLQLVYRMKTSWMQGATNREIFKLKIPVPEEVMMRAEQIKKSRSATVVDITEVTERPTFKPPKV